MTGRGLLVVSATTLDTGGRINPMTTLPPPVSHLGTTGPQACPVCGLVGTLRSRENKITTKKRPKFGVFWVVATIITGGIALILWLIWPRSKQVVSVDRYLECGNCRSRV